MTQGPEIPGYILGRGVPIPPESVPDLTTARTISLSDRDWNRITQALWDHAAAQAELGFERAAGEVATLARFLTDSLAYARGEQ